MILILQVKKLKFKDMTLLAQVPNAVSSRARSQPRSSDCNFQDLSINENMATSNTVTYLTIICCISSSVMTATRLYYHCPERLSERLALCTCRVIL